MNNKNNNDSLDAISLGSIDNLNVMNDMNNLNNIETLDSNINNSSSSINEIPNVETFQPINNNDINSNMVPSNQDLNVNIDEVFNSNLNNYNTYDIPEPINNFNSTPIFNDIGTVPPMNNNNNYQINIINPEQPKKKGINKTLFVIIVILALILVGVIVYLLLHFTSVKKAPVEPKDISLELGSTLPGSINDYATFNGIDSNTCTLDTTSVTDVNKLGATYEYKIKCADKIYTGKIKIVDITKPEVTLKEVSINVDEEISPKDFIEACDDKTNCSYKFKDEKKVKEYVKKEGTHEVELIIEDESGNKVEAKGNLKVSIQKASIYLVCTKDNIVTKFGIVNNKFNKVAYRTYTFKLEDKTAYESFKGTNKDKEKVTYNEITGKPEYYDETSTLKITSTLSYDYLKKEANEEIPLEFSELMKFYNKKYSCIIGY